MKLKKKIPLIDQHDRYGFWGGKFGGSFIPDTLKKPIEDLTKEVADVMCMIELLKEHLYIKNSDIVQGIQNKRDKLKIWSNLINRNNS